MHRLVSCAGAIGFALGWLVAIGSGSAHERIWTEYRDGEHGCGLNFPQGLFTATPSRPGEAKRFITPQQKTFFQVLGVSNRPDWNAFDIRRKYLGAIMPGAVVYQHTTIRSLTLFGYRGDAVFHTKILLSEDLSSACILDINYPLLSRNRYHAMANRMLLSLHVRKAFH
jgi:hypothetical protein